MNIKSYLKISPALLIIVFFIGISCDNTVGTEEITDNNTLSSLGLDASISIGGDPVTLYAGQDIEAGIITVGETGEGNLTVTFETNDDWCLKETHLHIWDDEDDKPVNDKGNPVPGQFEYSETHECLDSYTYNADESSSDELNIAAHAVVAETESAPFYASSSIDANQGLKKNGDPVDAERSNPDNALEFETGQDVNNFFSLGFGGYITLSFEFPIVNGPGDDIRVIEDTWGGNFPLEKANVYVSQDGNTWELLGEADNTNLDVIHTFSFFDLEDLGWDWAQFVKVVDTTDPDIHNGNADAYDVNAVEALHDYVNEETETAWGAGDRFVDKGNWGTYFEYTPTTD